MVQSGSTLRQHFTTPFISSSKPSSAASMVSFWARKFTLTAVTPGSLAMASSIFQAKVDALTYQINKSADEIANTEKKIKAKEKEMKEREENLNARLKVMYKNGSLGFVDVLLGSGRSMSGSSI